LVVAIGDAGTDRAVSIDISLSSSSRIILSGDAGAELLVRRWLISSFSSSIVCSVTERVVRWGEGDGVCPTLEVSIDRSSTGDNTALAFSHGE